MLIVLIALTTLLALAACSHQPPMADRPQLNAVYYWRTELRLDSVERQFLADYDIKRLYCRYFDVVMSPQGEPRPNATIAFGDTLPRGLEVVPTVFITEACMHQHHDSLAERLVRRVVQMSQTNDVPPSRELQLDCDYTARSRDTYYRFLDNVRRLASDEGMALSVTIRLHQLSMPVPPADEGVLMLYNTGDPMRFQERNPVLDMRDVRPYLSHLPHFEMPMAVAYPVFRWHRNIYGMELEHRADADEVMRAKKAVEQLRPELRRRILTYHLDEENIKHYTHEEFQAIYQH